MAVKSLSVLLKDFVPSSLVDIKFKCKLKACKISKTNQTVVMHVYFTTKFGENLYIKIISLGILFLCNVYNVGWLRGH